MNLIVTPEIYEVMEAVKYRPAVSIILPFEPKMGLKKELTHSLKIAAGKVEKGLLENYPHETARIVSNTPEAVHAYVNDAPQRVANFSDNDERKERVLDKFLSHIDKSLDIILNAYRLPLFVVGTEKILGRFKKLSKHTGTVIEYAQGSYENATLPELKKIPGPALQTGKGNTEKLLSQLEEAAGKKKLSVGIKEIWREAMDNKGRI